MLTKIPVMSLTNLAALSLCHLDLSNNAIGAIHAMDLSNKFRVSLFTFRKKKKNCFLSLFSV